MRFQTIVAALLVAAVASAQTVGFPTAECYDCMAAITKPVNNCIEMGFSIGGTITKDLNTLSASEKKCTCAVVSTTNWVNACRSICPVAPTDAMYESFESTKAQCAGVSAQPENPSSATGSLAPSAGATLAIAAAAAVQALF
ncbi:hypothetical protein BG011_000335 [Mortierella polycephala]|uniref:Uncharacterized protein n=1 Tax=Mortierella polycephala TaxID=41804 RepID=A0A9P6PLA9_9FUNG|nr:hypothetical protein BG011_000335 [Mortierella polycephala]